VPTQKAKAHIEEHAKTKAMQKAQKTKIQCKHPNVVCDRRNSRNSVRMDAAKNECVKQKGCPFDP